MGPVVVCGASYFSPASDLIPEFKGKHFSQLVANALGRELVVLSGPGVSNFSIGLQVDHALKLDPKPSLILTGNTRWDRIDFPIGDPTGEYSRSVTIDGQLYDAEDHFSYNRNPDPWFISTSLTDFFNLNTIRRWQKKYPTFNPKISSIQKYFEYIYDNNIKRYMDTSIVYHYYHQLHISGIPYIICYEDLMYSDKSYPFPWMRNDSDGTSSNNLSNIIKPILNNAHRGDCPFHTTVEAQEVAAKIILKFYNEHLNSGR